MSVLPGLDGVGISGAGDIKNYLFLLDERLRYLTSNLGAENFSDASLSELGNIVTAPLRVRLEDAEGSLSELNVRLDSITLSVSDGDGGATLELRAGDVVLSSAKLNFEGFVTFKSLMEAGEVQINGSNIVCRLTDAGTEGRIIFGYVPERGEPGEAGGLYVDDRGDEEGGAKYRVYLYSGSVGSQPFALKLLSSSDMSIESIGDMWITSGGEVHFPDPSKVFFGEKSLAELLG